jgi:hypothetical protein
LDKLIKQYGNPSHIKIDVEGYELTVLKGLTRKSGMISFEWVEEQYNEIIESIDYLFKLGYREFNWIDNDLYTYRPNFWMGNHWMKKQLRELQPERKQRWGMIFAR